MHCNKCLVSDTWPAIFRDLWTPSVEVGGLNYECQTSMITIVHRFLGNIFSSTQFAQPSQINTKITYRVIFHLILRARPKVPADLQPPNLLRFPPFAADVSMNIASVPYMKIVALRKELRARGQEARGNKAALVDRLTTLLSKDESIVTQSPARLSTVEDKRKPQPEPFVEESEDVLSNTRPSSPKYEEKIESAPTDSILSTKSAVVTIVAQEPEHPLSEKRMRKRAERFGLSWPRPGKASFKESGKRQANATSKNCVDRDANIGDSLSEEETERRAKRARRFGVK